MSPVVSDAWAAEDFAISQLRGALTRPAVMPP